MNELIYIFLDVDGVLNTRTDWKRPFTLNKKCVDRFNDKLSTIKKKYDVKIILSSTWKNGFVSNNHAPHIKDLMSQLECEIIGKTDDMNNRAAEINSYIAKHKLNPDRCYCIDDDRSLFKKKCNFHLIFTDENTGYNNESIIKEKSFWRDLWDKFAVIML